MKKKGQTEIIGILIVVFIVSIGLFMYVSLKMAKPTNDTFLSFQEQELSHATKLALLNSYVDGCTQGTLYDNIKNMAKNPSCESDIKGGIENMLKATIGESGANMNYYYEIYNCDDHRHPPNGNQNCGIGDIIIQGPSDYDVEGTDTNKCAYTKEDITRLKETEYPIKTNTITYYFKLKLCR